jgi:putative N6-adenine-specific DNA methylase
MIANPPYGGRVGDRKALYALYGAFGAVLRDRFAGWRVGIVTSDPALAQATGLSLDAGPPVPHGGLKVRLHRGAI